MTDENIVLLSELDDKSLLRPKLFHQDLHVGTLIYNRVPIRYYRLDENWDREFCENATYKSYENNIVSQIYNPGEGVATVIDVANVTHKKIYVLYMMSGLGSSFVIHGQYETIDRRFRMQNPVWPS